MSELNAADANYIVIQAGVTFKLVEKIIKIFSSHINEAILHDYYRLL